MDKKVGEMGAGMLLIIIVVGALLASTALHWAEDKTQRWRRKRWVQGKSTIPLVSNSAFPSGEQKPATAAA